MKELDFKEVQQTALGILKYIHSICEKEEIKYFIAYGTLIGAIRHHGFIPWDDDLDIMMPRPDFDRLVSYFSKHDTGPYKLMNLKTTPAYPYFNTRICDTRTIIETSYESSSGMGVFIDVCAMDGLGCDYNYAIKKMSKSKKLCSSMFLATRNDFHMGLTKGWKKKILKYPAYVVTHILGKSFFVRHMENLLRECDYDGSDYVGCLVWSTYAPKKEVFPKTWIENIKLGDFEDGEFFIPEHYDDILRTIYGDYMKLPPEEERIYHHLFTAYQK